MFKSISLKSYFLISLQVVCGAVIIFTGRFFPELLILKIIFILLFVPIFWAIVLLNTKLTITPELRYGAKLIENGPFRFVRHPIYFSLIAICIIWLVDDFSYIRLIFSIILFIDLVLKVNYEETFMLKEFEDYKEYQRKTKKIIPFIY